MYDCSIRCRSLAGESIQLYIQGDISINDGAGVVNTIPAVVVAGENNNFGSGLENENTNGDGIFIFTDYREQAGQEYDDLITWISPNILKTHMVQAFVVYSEQDRYPIVRDIKEISTAEIIKTLKLKFPK